MSVRSCGCENATGDSSSSSSISPGASLTLPHLFLLHLLARLQMNLNPHKKGVKRSVCDFRMFFKATRSMRLIFKIMLHVSKRLPHQQFSL